MEDEEIEEMFEELEIDALRAMRRYEVEHGIAVKYRCKKCGKKFKERLYPTVKTIDLSKDIDKQLEPNVQCPKCKSSDVEER